MDDDVGDGAMMITATAATTKWQRLDELWFASCMDDDEDIAQCAVREDGRQQVVYAWP